MRGPLDDVAQLLRTLWAGGSGRPDPELRSELGPVADAVEQAGAVQLAETLRSLGEALAAGDDAAAFQAQLQVWVRLRGLRRGLAAQALRLRLQSGPEAEVVEADGWSGVFLPLGALVVAPRVHVHGVDVEGGWRTFAEQSVRVDGYDAFASPWISRLFQAELTLGEALGRTWELTGHPGVPTARRWVGRPAFGTRPRLGRTRVDVMEIPSLSSSERMGIGRAEVLAQRGREGWTVRSGGQRVRLDPCLELNLDKLAAVEGATVRREAVVLASQGERVLLQWGEPPSFPTLDPRACRWAPEALRKQATGSWGAVLRVLLGDAIGVREQEGLGSMDGFPLPDSSANLPGDDDPEASAQAFWRQWVALRAGRAPRGPAPTLLAALRGAAAGEVVGPERLLQALWSVERSGGLAAEAAVLAQVAAARPVAREGDLLEAVLQARLMRHGGVASSEGDERARVDAYRERVEEELAAMGRRLASVRGAGLLGIAVAAVAGAAGAVLCRWVKGRGAPGEEEVLAWAVAEGSGRLDVFIEM